MTADLLAAGWRCHQAGNLPRAEQAYRQLVQQELDNAQGWYLLGVVPGTLVHDVVLENNRLENVRNPYNVRAERDIVVDGKKVR
jgi:hypothetical protein